MLYRFDSRDDIYEFGSGLPVLMEEQAKDPKCMRLAMALCHRAMALVAHLPGLEVWPMTMICVPLTLSCRHKAQITNTQI
jgi:hypothetical protein